MTEIEKHKIANSFPGQFEQSSLEIEISQSEFKIFEDGKFAQDMDDKWNVFVLDKVLYLARSWSDFCIHKVFTELRNENVLLSHFQVNRDKNQYRSTDIQYDSIFLRKILQLLLGREDFYSDPKLELPLIKETLELIDPKNEFKKSVGSNNAGMTRQIYNALTSDEQKRFFDVIGWTELKEMLSSFSDDEPLINLSLQKPGFSTTFYFDKDANQILGQTTIISDDLAKRIETVLNR